MSQNFSSDNSQANSDQEDNSENEMVIENEDNISGNQISQEENIQDDNTKIIEIKESEDQKLATYYFPKEDHTLGNALVFMINQHPDINFCGYSLLHPSEQGINVLQKGKRTKDILTDSLDNLENICNSMLSKVNLIKQLIQY